MQSGRIYNNNYYYFFFANSIQFKYLYYNVKSSPLFFQKDWQGIIHYELLPYGQTPNSDLYCQQSDRLREIIAQKLTTLARRGIVFNQDNARPYTHIDSDSPEAPSAGLVTPIERSLTM